MPGPGPITRSTLTRQSTPPDSWSLLPSKTSTVTADGPFGPVPPLTYVLDLMDYKGHMHRPVGSLHLLTKAVENIEDKLGSNATEKSTPDTLR